MTDWKKPERYKPGPGMPSLPPQLQEMSGKTGDEILEQLNRLPFFMTNLDETDGDGGENVELEALKALAYEGPPEEIALGFKNQGNENYKLRKYKDALEFYTKALEVHCSDNDLNATCYVNRAACQLELKNYRKCIKDCSEALKLNPTNVKAVYRSSRAYLILDKIGEALEVIDYGLSFDPESKPLKDLRESCLARQAKLDELEAKRKQVEERKQSIIRNLKMAIESRKYILKTTTTGNTGASENLKLSLADEMSPGSPLLVPVMFLYPLELETDLFQHSDESTTIQSHLDQLFESPPAWFNKDPARYIEEYQLNNLQVYAETNTGGLAKIGKKSTLAKVLGAGIPIIDNVARFYVVPKNKAEDWVKNWKSTVTSV